MIFHRRQRILSAHGHPKAILYVSRTDGYVRLRGLALFRGQRRVFLRRGQEITVGPVKAGAFFERQFWNKDGVGLAGAFKEYPIDVVVVCLRSTPVAHKR